MTKTENLRMLKRDGRPEASVSCFKTEPNEQGRICLDETERLSLAKIVKADSPFVAKVVRDE